MALDLSKFPNKLDTTKFPDQSPVDLATKLASKVLSPLTAPPLQEIAANLTQPELVNPAATGVNAGAFERSEAYPPQGVTTLAPSIDIALLASATPELAKLGVGATKLAVEGGKALKNKVLGNPLLDAVSEIKRLPSVPKGQLELGLGDAASGKPNLSAAAQTAPLMEEKGLTNPPTLEQLKAQLGRSAPEVPKLEAYVKGIQRGIPAKGIPDVPIYGVRGGTSEENLKFFGDAAPGSVTPAQLEKANIALPTTEPKPLVPSPVPAKQPTLPLATGNIGEPTTPIIPPVQRELVKPLPEGASTRIAMFKVVQGKDVPTYSPFATSSELATKTGSLEKTVRDQLQSGLKAEAQGEQKANEVLTNFKKQFTFAPASDESAAISAYGRAPDKAAAREVLDRTIGPERASKIVQAESDMRTNFDSLLERLNKDRVANGEAPINRRIDYHTQIRDYNLLDNLGLSKQIGTPEGDAAVEKIMTAAQQLKNSKFNHLADIVFRHVKKQGVPDVEDAVTGFQTYVRQAERKMALQPHVNELRATAESIKDTYPNLAKEYINRADFIAGKQEPLDAAIQNIIGPDAFKAFTEASNRMKANLIQGNPHVPVSQMFVIPSIAADLPIRDSMAATVKLVGNKEFRDFLIQSSPTLQLRLEAQSAQAINEGKVAGLLSKPSNFVDTSTLLYSLAGKTLQLVREGVPLAEAVKQAEQFASLTQATLSKLNTAPLLRSQTAQATLPFMNQVLSQARFVGTQLFKNKSLAGKAATAAKLGGTGLAIATATNLLLGDKAKTPLDTTQYVPLGPALEQGLGGPVLGSAGRILKAPTVEDKLLQVFRAAMLIQNKIPAGLQVSKIVESIFKKPKNED